MVRSSAGPRNLPRQSFLKCSAGSHGCVCHFHIFRAQGGRMPRYVLIGALTLACVANPVAQTVEQDVMKAEQARIEARRKPGSALIPLTPDDHLTVGPNGQMQEKKGLAALTAAPRAMLREVKIQRFGDVAIATGIQSGFGADADHEHRFTRIWRLTNGHWLNAFGQVTRMNSPQPAAGAPLKEVPPTVWPKGSAGEEAAVLEALRRLEDAYARKDVAAYGPLTLANYLRVSADGSTESRETFLKAVAGTPELKRNVPNLSEFRVRVYGPVAVVTWLNKSVGGREAGVRRSRLLVKEGGSWKQLMSQDTVVT